MSLNDVGLGYMHGWGLEQPLLGRPREKISLFQLCFFYYILFKYIDCTACLAKQIY